MQHALTSHGALFGQHEQIIQALSDAMQKVSDLMQQIASLSAQVSLLVTMVASGLVLQPAN